MKVIKGGVTKPKGFMANGVFCGIKRKKLDLSLIVCNKPAVSAGVFTKNSVKAAPVIVTEKHLKNNIAQAIIVNSGNANCFTGSFGLIYAKRTAELFANILKINSKDVIVASTGIIGKPLPFMKISKAAKSLVNGLGATKSHGLLAAKGIMTTDTVYKETAVVITIGGKKVTIGGCAKGSGMIEPNMATMLSFITTDADISKNMLKAALKKGVDPSFNSITVDGCMSTNDMVTILASGEAKNKKIKARGKDFDKFVKALQCVCIELAKKIVLDGEGATKFIEINVTGAKTKAQAKEIAMKVANSNLVKTAAYGSDPNWGRVASAVGSLGLKITEKNLKISFSSFSKKSISINVGLNLGKEKATVYTSDLSMDYIKINAHYN